MSFFFCEFVSLLFGLRQDGRYDWRFSNVINSSKNYILYPMTYLKKTFLKINIMRFFPSELLNLHPTFASLWESLKAMRTVKRSFSSMCSHVSGIAWFMKKIDFSKINMLLVIILFNWTQILFNEYNSSKCKHSSFYYGSHASQKTL